MASSLPSVLTALEAKIAAALPNAQKVVGEPGTFIAAEQYLFGDVTGQDVPNLLMGGNPQAFTESYDVNVHLRSYKGGQDVEARRTRGVAMKDAVRDALAADMSIGLGAAFRVYVAGYTVRSGYDASGEGVAAEVDLTIHVDNLQP